MLLLGGSLRQAYIRTCMTCIAAKPLWVYRLVFGTSFFPQRSGVNSQVLHFTFTSSPLFASQEIHYHNLKLYSRVVQYTYTSYFNTHLVNLHRKINKQLSNLQKKQTAIIQTHPSCVIFMVIQLKKAVKLIIQGKKKHSIEFLPKTGKFIDTNRNNKIS